MQTILPELDSGRGTARRVVEGQTRDGLRNHPTDRRIRVLQNVNRWNAEGRDSRLAKPRIPHLIPLRAISTRMRLAVDFDRQPRIAAEEIEHIRPAGMLPAELQTLRPLA